MARTTRIWVLAAMVVVAATVARAVDDELGEYYQKRTQETRFRRGGPLHDLVNAASRYHQELNSRYGIGSSGKRYLLEEGGAAADAEAPAAEDVPIHNTLKDHELIGA